MLNKKIAIIGFGNMGKAFYTGLIENKLAKKNNFYLSNTSISNKIAVSNAEIVIFAIKPQILVKNIIELKFLLNSKLIISIAAGIQTNTIEKILGKNSKIVRVMPNICVKVGESMSCWVKNKNVDSNQIEVVKKILCCVGKEIELKDENLLDQVTAVSGSGPAYFFYLTELLEKAAFKIGLSKKISTQLAKQTIIGSAKLLEFSNIRADELKKNVISKGGTTEKALEYFYKNKLDNIFIAGIFEAYKKALKLHFTD